VRVSALKGMVRAPKRRVSVEEMDASAAKGAVRRVGRG
jgi:hypothetical protein